MLKDIKKNRLKKRDELRKRGIDPYPSVSRAHTPIKDVLLKFDELLKTPVSISVTGRIMSMRSHGGATFLDLRDASGALQALFKRDVISKEQYAVLESLIDIGDILWLTGMPFRTKRGAATLEVGEFAILAKTVRPLPEKWHGLKDREERYRKRYLDFIFNPSARAVFEVRSRVIRELRNILDAGGFFEVETPILQVIPGGALARPFKTELNALNLNLYLRIAPELYLKRLLVGQFEKVYELGRAFRNEGMDRSHNPEFTLLEAYMAYENAEGLMRFVESTLTTLIQNIIGQEVIAYEGHTIGMRLPWQRIEYGKLLHTYTGISMDTISMPQLRKVMKNLAITVGKQANKWELIDELYKKTCQPKLLAPTFIVDHPVEISPLAKKKPDDPTKVERFQLIIGGIEIVNGFSELNDPGDQRDRFKTQERLRRDGTKDIHRMDKDFIEALEYGMPPAAGLGIGIDRLVMLLTNTHNIRDVILFPTMKPKK